MKITAGLGSEAEYERFVRAGADEFFVGMCPIPGHGSMEQ